jgi:hypothetical protein
LSTGAGAAVGAGVGAAVGAAVGAGVGADVGAAVGAGVGAAVGAGVGASVGAAVGEVVGEVVGAVVGVGVGEEVGEVVGDVVGALELVGAEVRRQRRQPKPCVLASPSSSTSVSLSAPPQADIPVLAPIRAKASVTRRRSFFMMVRDRGGRCLARGRPGARVGSLGATPSATV